MVISIDKDLKPVKSRLFLCKPNRETICELQDAYGKKIKFTSNGIDELNFKLPYKVMRNNKYVKNKHIDKVKGHYLVRYEEGNYKEYFIITKPIKSSDNGINIKEIKCFLLPYELNNKLVRNYKVTKKLYDSLGIDGILNDTLLRLTDWSIGYIDIDVALKYRTFDVSEKTLLDFMNELTDAFDCIVLWDTMNKKINFHKSNSLGQDKGLSIEYGKYLKSIEVEPDFENVVTRLFIYGKDRISINKYNPAGTDYLESFAYYMHPFERNENRNVLSHSLYMSDELCHAILDYQELLSSKQNEFKTLLENLDNKQTILFQKQNELFILQTDLNLIEDNLVTANATGNPTSDLILQKNNKLVEINAKQAEINQISNDMNIINNQINIIKSEVAIENNFTPELIIERDRFIREKAWSNEHYFDEEELYEEGERQLQKIHQPIIQYKIDIVDFKKVVHCKKDWNKLNKYDIVTINYPELNISIKAKIIQIERDDDGNAIALTIANADDIRGGFIDHKDLIAKFASSSTRVDMSKFKWDETESNLNEVRQIINNEYDATKRRIVAGVNESVEISRRGLVITNPDNPNEMLVGQSGVLALSQDGGNTWKVAIRPTHIVADLIMGRLLAGTNLIIDATDESGQKTFTVDKNGVKIKGAALTIEDGLSPDQLDPSFKNSLVELNKLYTNGVLIDTENGLVITRTDDKVKSIFNATDGIKIQIKENGNFVDRFYFDANTSKLIIDGDIIARKLIIGNGDAIKDNKIDGSFIDKINANQLIINNQTLTDEIQDIKFEFSVLDGKLTSVIEEEIALLDGKIASNTSLITQNANEITLKVSSTDFNGDTIASKITQSASAIELISQNINLSGKVTFTSFDSNLQSTINGKANTSSLGSLAYSSIVETAQLGSTIIQGGFIRTELISTNISQVNSRLHLGGLYNVSGANKGIFFSDGSRIIQSAGVDGIYISAPQIILETTTYLGSNSINNQVATKGDLATVVAKWG